MKFLKTISLILTTSIYANSSSILPDSSNLGSSNWYDSTWLGVYYESSNGWVYHATLGWIYIPSSDLESLWIYNHEIKWFWTTSSIYPWIYVDKKIRGDTIVTGLDSTTLILKIGPQKTN